MIKPRYVLTPTPLVYQKMRLSIRDGEGRKERGHPKISGKSFIKISEVIWGFTSYKSTENVTY